MSQRQEPPRRAAFPHFVQMQTRWADNDSYGHVNNVAYYSFFDTAVNRHLIENGALDIARSEAVGLVVDTGCRFFSSVSFPDLITLGLRVAHLGNSSVRYEIGVFRNREDEASALGHFVHVYVERSSNRPTRVPDAVRAVLEPLMTAAGRPPPREPGDG